MQPKDQFTWGALEIPVFTVYGLIQLANTKKRIDLLNIKKKKDNSRGKEINEIYKITRELIPNVDRTLDVLRNLCPSEVLGFIDLALDNDGLHSETQVLHLYAQSHPVIISIKNNLNRSVRTKILIQTDRVIWEDVLDLEVTLPNILFIEVPNHQSFDCLKITMPEKGACVNINIERPFTGFVRFEIVDGKTKRAIPVRIKLEDGRGNYFFPTAGNLLLDMATRYRPMWFYTKEPFDLNVPLDGSVSLVVSKGFEYKKQCVRVCPQNVKGNTLHVELHRWINMAQKGWYSGEVHLHSNVMPKLDDYSGWEILPEAEGLDLAFLQICNISGQIFSNEYPIGELTQFSQKTKSIISIGEEFRNNVYGHLCLLNIKEIIPPISTGLLAGKSCPDYPPNLYVCDEAHRQGGIVVAHSGWEQVLETEVPKFSNPGSFETPIDLAFGKIDLLEVNDIRVVSEWYRVLNCGFRVPAATGPDFFLSDCRRVYVQTGNEFNIDFWLQNLRKGKSFLTNGPMIFLTVDGNEPGAIIKLEKYRKVSIHCCAMDGRNSSLSCLEIVFNGKIIRSTKEMEGKEILNLDFEFMVEESGWIAARCTSINQEFWAHTNPVYIEMSDSIFAVEKDLQVMLETICKLKRWVDNRAVFENEKQKAEVLELCNKGIEYYKKRITDLSASKNEENFEASTFQC